LGYKGQWIGESNRVTKKVDENTEDKIFTFKEPIMIQNKSVDIKIPFDFSNAEPKEIKTNLILLFGDKVNNQTIDVSANIVEGPNLDGIIRWNTITELPPKNAFSDPEYDKKQDSHHIDKSTKGDIDINLGKVPESVRSTIEIVFNNSSAKQGYKAIITIDNITEGLSVEYGESATNKIYVDMDPGYAFLGNIQVTAKKQGNQSFQIHVSYDRDDYGLPELNMLVSLDVIKLSESVKIYGIDFGTTNSCIAYYGDIEATTVNMEEKGSQNYGGPKEYLYSFCCFPDQDKPKENFVGRYAEMLYARITDKNSIGIKSVKTKLGTEWKLLVGGEQLSAKDIASIIIKELVTRAVNELCILPRKAIITVPANSSLKKINETREAYAKAGINVEDVIYEPEAATYYYLLGTQFGRQLLTSQLQSSKPYTILTFDFGGGTLDLSIIQVLKKSQEGKNKIEIRVLRSSAKYIGGDNIDWGLRRDAIKKSTLPANERDLYWKRISEIKTRPELKSEVLRDLPLTRLQLIKYCERAKIRFGESEIGKFEEIFVIESKISKSKASIEIFKNSFDDICKSLWNDSIKGFIDQVMQGTKLDGRSITKNDIDKVLMAGGSSSIVFYQQEIKKMFGDNKVDLLESDAKTAVSKGAALYANERHNPRSIYEFSKVEPKIDVRIGYMANTEFGPKFIEIFNQGTHIGAISEKNEVIMPTSGTYKLIVGTNKGNNDNWQKDNNDLYQIAEPTYEATPGDTVEEWFELDSVGNLVWYVNHKGNITAQQVEILDRADSGDNDPGF
jgi:molecular chaperone DnaK (HSP70)